MGAGFSRGELIRDPPLLLLLEEGSKLKSEFEKLVMRLRDRRIFLNGDISFICFSILMPEPLLTNFCLSKKCPMTTEISCTRLCVAV